MPFLTHQNTRAIIADVVAEEIEKDNTRWQMYFDKTNDNDLMGLAFNMTGVNTSPLQNDIGKEIIWRIHLELERRNLIKNFYQCFYDRVPPIYGTVDYPRANE